MKAAVGYLILLVLALLLVFGNTRVTRIDDDVTLVTADALPEAVLVLKRGPDPVVRLQHITRQKPVALAEPGRPAPAESATLPAPCATIKYYNAHFTPGQLEDMRVAARLPRPTAAQARAIEACIRS